MDVHASETEIVFASTDVVANLCTMRCRYSSAIVLQCCDTVGWVI